MDTYGNLLWIDEILECPINKMKVDLDLRTDDYLNNNYNYAPLSNMTYNYRFFYSNEFTDGNNSVIIIKSEDEPKYITMNNFIIDDEVYKEKFGDIEILEDLGNFLGDIFNKKDKTQNTIDYIDKSIKIVQLLV